MIFCEILRSLIEEHNLTQKQVAHDLHIPVSTLGGYVQGTSEPDFATLKLLADYFRVSVDYLLDHQTGQAANHQEDDMLRIFRSLTAEQKCICMEQCKVFVRWNHKQRDCFR